jgi:putative DNA primase/helicase
VKAAEIHAQIGNRWPDILRQLGVHESNLSNKGSPCPGCGGKDRYFFSNKFGRGDFFCRRCSPVVGGKQRGGDGFTLLQMVHGWDFKTARARVLEAAGLRESRDLMAPIATTPKRSEPKIAQPPRRVLELLRSSCELEVLPAAMEYLSSRHLLPLPPAHGLHGHAGAEYFDGNGQRIGRFAALLAPVRDIGGDLVTMHVTYLEHGRKLGPLEPRKLLSPLTGRTGCAVRLMPAGEALGIAEGVETALSAAAIDDVPVWAALNAPLLARFEPPPGVMALRVYADRDEAGLMAALRLLERLQGRIRVEIRTPQAPAKDWNDVLVARRGKPT